MNSLPSNEVILDKLSARFEQATALRFRTRPIGSPQRSASAAQPADSCPQEVQGPLRCLAGQWAYHSGSVSIFVLVLCCSSQQVHEIVFNI